MPKHKSKTRRKRNRQPKFHLEPQKIFRSQNSIVQAATLLSTSQSKKMEELQVRFKATLQGYAITRLQPEEIHLLLKTWDDQGELSNLSNKPVQKLSRRARSAIALMGVILDGIEIQANEEEAVGFFLVLLESLNETKGEKEYLKAKKRLVNFLLMLYGISSLPANHLYYGQTYAPVHTLYKFCKEHGQGLTVLDDISELMITEGINLVPISTTEPVYLVPGKVCLWMDNSQINYHPDAPLY